MTMLKKDIFEQAEAMQLDMTTLLTMMFDWFEAHELEEFFDHVKEELKQ